MTTPYEEGWRTMFVGGLIMLVTAFVVLHRAQVAEEAHRVVPSHRYATWMSPTQAYVASALTFGGGIGAIALGVRAYRRERQHRSDANI